jgi:hypothetical protein
MPPFDRYQAGAAIILVATLPALVAPAAAQQPAPHGSFTATLSNITPLAFGMHAQEAARALGAPLTYVGGRPGDEIFLAFRHDGGSGLFPRNDRLYLQFEGGRLTGWKSDWGARWMWQ